MKRLPALALASFLAAVQLWAGAALGPEGRIQSTPAAWAATSAAQTPAPTALSSGAAAPARLQCSRPQRLRLQRFEDGSAKLFCARRLLARIGVPW
jgi:hypothetical protein